MAFPLHHCHMSCRCLVAFSDRDSVDRTTDTVKQSQRRVTSRTVFEACLLTTRSKTFRQHLKCSLTAPRRAGTSSGFFCCFFLLSKLSEPGRLGTALSGPASRLASAMTFSGCDTSPTVDCCSFSICRTQSLGQRNLEGLENVRLDELTVVRRHRLFFFLMLTRMRALGERGDKILRWRHSNCTHNDACRRETA